MAGTGTKTDPYVVSTWAELSAKMQESGVYIKLSEQGGVIDLNDEFPDGISRIEVRCREVQGNNWKIRNLYIKDKVALSADNSAGGDWVSEINDLHFLNIVCQNGTLVCGNYASLMKFNRCQFSGIFSSNNQETVMNGYSFGFITLDRCSLNFKINNCNTFYKIILCQCNIKLSGIGEAIVANKFDNCYLSGNYKSTNADAIILEAISSTGPSGSCYSVVDIELSSYKDNAKVTSEGELSNMVLINTDKIQSGVSIAETLNKVTTIQLTDAEYLSSIGFPIGVD